MQNFIICIIWNPSANVPHQFFLVVFDNFHFWFHFLGTMMKWWKALLFLKVKLAIIQLFLPLCSNFLRMYCFSKNLEWKSQRNSFSLYSFLSAFILHTVYWKKGKFWVWTHSVKNNFTVFFTMRGKFEEIFQLSSFNIFSKYCRKLFLYSFY